MKKSAHLPVVLVVLAACCLAGCFDIEQSVTLNRDLSGKAGFTMTVNMEPMVLFMVNMQRGMQGKTGDPTPAEIAEAKKEFLAQKKEKDDAGNFAARKAEAVKHLPPGVQLLDAKVDDQGMKMVVHMLFGFDDISKLAAINFPEDKPAGAEGKGAGPRNPMSQPFAGLHVKDEGKTILLTAEAMDPVAKQQTETPDLTPEMKQQMEAAFQGFRIAWKVEAPFDVVESNATRREGHTLYWEYDLPALEKLAREKKSPEALRVRFRK
jgi:hypothetical protein